MFSKNMGPCVLVFDDTELGETYGGTNFLFGMSTAKSMADKTGETARSKIVTGVSCTVTTTLTEPTLLQLSKVVYGSEYALIDTARLQLQAPVGYDLVENAKILILKPIIESIASADEEDWIYIPKASVVPNFDVPYMLDSQKVWAVEFEGHPVTAADIASGARLYCLGYEENDVAVLGYQSSM